MKTIRKEFNLSQQDLALLLNVSRSTIAMYENGLRPMPAKVWQKWTQLQLLWQEHQQKCKPPQTDKNGYLEIQQQQSLSQLNTHVQRAAARSVSLTQQLTQMEAQYLRLVKKIHLLKGLMQETPVGSRQMELLKNREQLARIQLADCCPQRRQLLAFQLKVLTAQQKAALAGTVIVQQQG